MTKTTLTYFSLIVLITLIPISICQSVAIIGSGIGGCGAAHYLSKFGKKFNKITMFEKEQRTGGRILTEKVDNNIFDLGSSGFFLDSHKLFKGLVEEMKLDYHNPYKKAPIVSFIKDKEVVQTLSPSKLVNMMKVVYNYGFSPISLHFTLNSVESAFKNIYSHLDKGDYFKGIKEFLDIINLKKTVNLSFRQYLEKEGIDKDYIKNILGPMVVSIYNQEIENLNAVAGLMALINLHKSDVYKINDGTHKLIDKLLENLKKTENFKLIHKKVNKITKNKENNNYILDFDGNSEEFDVIILAAPYQTLDITIEGFTIEENNKAPNAFIPQTKTFLQGEFNSSLNLIDKNLDNIQMVYSNKKSSLNNISFIAYIKSRDYYLLHSDYKLQNSQISEYFTNYKILKTYTWDKACSELYPMSEEILPSFEIADSIYYLNGMETAACGMEISLISAKNAVNIIEKKECKECKKKEEL